MAEAKVRGVTLYYEVIGNAGPWITLTPGSRRPCDELIPMAQLLARHGHRVLLHDRRNCGRSEVGIEASGSEHETWADDLRALAAMSARRRSIRAAARPARGSRFCTRCAIRPPRAACCCGG